MIPRTNPPFSRKCGLKIGQRLILNLFLTTFTTASTQGPIDVVFVEVQFLYSHLFPIKFLHGRIPDVYQPIIKDFLVEWVSGLSGKVAVHELTPVHSFLNDGTYVVSHFYTCHTTCHLI